MPAELDISTSDILPMTDVPEDLPLSHDGVLSSSELKREPADFVRWTWAMLNAGHEEIGWSLDGTQIVVRNAERLALNVLPKYFRHSQYASFVRALNAYHFRKLGTGRWHNPSFRRDRPDLLPTIRRKPQARSVDAKNKSVGGEDDDGGASTSLVRAPKRSLATTTGSDDELRQLWLMQKNVSRLETELEQMRGEDFQQRYDAVRLFQMLLKRPLTAGPRSPPIVLQPQLQPPYAGQNPRLRMLTSRSWHEGSAVDHTDLTVRVGAAAHLSAVRPSERVVDTNTVSSGDGTCPPPLPPSPTSSFGGLDLERIDLPSVSVAPSFDIPTVSAAPSFDIASLGLDMRGAHETTARASPFPSPLPQKSHASTRQGGLAFAANGSSGGGATTNAGCASNVQTHECDASDCVALLASMPMLPPSTSQLPPAGTLQREQLEAAVDWYFQQLTISSERLMPIPATTTPIPATTTPIPATTTSSAIP